MKRSSAMVAAVVRARNALELSTGNEGRWRATVNVGGPF
jgi:hypothetical protein